MSKANCGFEDAQQLVISGPTLSTQIGFDSSFRPGLPLHLPEKEYDALVDTGARWSCIDSQVALALNLPIVDRRPLSGALGAGMANMHMAQMHIPSLRLNFYGMFAGVHLHAGGQPHSALLGRDFLQHYRMTYDGQTGAVEIVKP